MRFLSLCSVRSPYLVKHFPQTASFAKERSTERMPFTGLSQEVKSQLLNSLEDKLGDAGWKVRNAEIRRAWERLWEA